MSDPSMCTGWEPDNVHKSSEKHKTFLDQIPHLELEKWGLELLPQWYLTTGNVIAKVSWRSEIRKVR